MCDDVFGEGWGSSKIAHLSTGDKIGVEIFEFKYAEQRENNFEYWKTGVFHFCVQDPGVEGLAAKIVEPAASRECRKGVLPRGKAIPDGIL